MTAMQVGQPGSARRGFLRNGILAPFLQHLAAATQPPHYQDETQISAHTALKLAEEYAAHKTWLTLLERAVSASGIEASCNGTQLPIAGGSCVVFNVSSYIYKFLAKVRYLIHTQSRHIIDDASGISDHHAKSLVVLAHLASFLPNTV